MKEITIDCGACGGVGYEEGMTGTPPSPVQTDCVRCEGTGQLHHGYLSDDLIDLLNDVKDKVDDIKEKVDEIKDAM